MRNVYSEELEQLSNNLRRMGKLVYKAMQRAEQCLLNPDLALAERVISDDDNIDALQHTLDDACINLLALQAPVATDLRQVVSTLRISQTLERQGDLARHIAEIARGAHPHPPVPEPILGQLQQMASICTSMAEMEASLLKTPCLDMVTRIQDEDEILDDAHFQVRCLLGGSDLVLERDQVVNAVLLDRFLERFGDHAASVARRTTFLLTGEM